MNIGHACLFLHAMKIPLVASSRFSNHWLRGCHVVVCSSGASYELKELCVALVCHGIPGDDQAKLFFYESETEIGRIGWG